MFFNSLNRKLKKSYLVLNRDIQAKVFRIRVDAGIGGLQSGIRRQFQNGGHADGQHRIQKHITDVAEQLFEALPATDLIANRNQYYKNAGKQADIVIGKNG